VLYGGLFFVAGSVLMAVTYLLVRQSLLYGAKAVPSRGLTILTERPGNPPEQAQVAEKLAKDFIAEQ
jgi:hypothetical protein